MVFVYTDFSIVWCKSRFDEDIPIYKHETNFQQPFIIGWGNKPQGGRICLMIFSIVYEKFAASVVEALFDLPLGNLMLFLKLLKNGGRKSDMRLTLIVYTARSSVKCSSEQSSCPSLYAIAHECGHAPRVRKKTPTNQGFRYFGGGAGIRTLDASFSSHTPLAGEPLQPLGHAS